MLLVLLIASCGGGGGGGPTEQEVRACLNKGAAQLAGDPIFIVVKEQPDDSEGFIGIRVQDFSKGKAQSGTITISVSDSVEFLDALEEQERQELRQNPNVTDRTLMSVNRSESAVASYFDDFGGSYARAKRLVQSCLQPGTA